MPRYWVPLDVNYQDDPAIAVVSPVAELIYIRGLAMSKKLGTDGFIDSRLVGRLTEGGLDPEACEELVTEGLWEQNGHGWHISGWQKHNPSSDVLSEAGTLGNHRRWHDGNPSPDCPHCVEAMGGDSGGESPGDASRSESREEKSREEQGRSRAPTGKRTRRKATTPMPEPFVVTDDMKDWVRRKFPNLDWVAATEKWVNSIKAKGYQYVDWKRAWMTGMQNASEWAKTETGPVR